MVRSGPGELPASGQVGGDAVVRVLSYNVRSLRDDPAAVARVVRACAPDLVLVQEAPRFFRWRKPLGRLAAEAPGLTTSAADASVPRDVDAVFDVRAIFQTAHADVAIETLPDLLRPQKGRHGLRDYSKVFSPDFKGGTDIFDARGIDRERGALIVVRPDQYVAQVLPLAAHAELSAFFAGFMRAAAGAA